MQRQIIRSAFEKGFSSVWMTIFEDEPDILHEMIKAFPGTETAFFDAEGHPEMRMTKQFLALSL